MVYVLSTHNKPLMPCSNAIARLLLKSGKAKVKRREPFTIKLTYETTEYTQPLALGVDTGSGTFATAVADENDNILYTSEVKVRNDITDKMTQRAKYRRNRRNRKTRYRKPRWLNRHNSIKSNRFSPQGRKFKLKTDVIYIKKCVPEGDYQKTKGICSEQMLNTRKIAGFKKFDKVKYKGNMYFIKGRITKGAYAILMNIEGEKQIFTNPKTVKLSTCKRVSARKSVLTTSIHLITYRSGSLLDVA